MRFRLTKAAVCGAALALALLVSASDNVALAKEPTTIDQFNNFVGRFVQGSQLQRVKDQVDPPATAYDRFLYDGYLTLSQTEFDEGDYRDSDTFAYRAEIAASGRRFKPEAIESRDLPTEILNLAARNRSRLIVAYLKGAAERVPDQAAEAQLAFDCWMQEQEEDFQVEDIAVCIERFDLAMSNIDIVINPTAIPEPTEPLERAVFEVFFDFDKADVTREAAAIIESFVAWTTAYKAPLVSVIGNADQAGETQYNLELSQRRADAVAAMLRDNGVDVAGVFARGDQAPAVDRPNRAPERENRRVLMVVRER
jgi:outer membrane protein OmpA-like peptidoglycan-associated protein